MMAKCREAFCFERCRNCQRDECDKEEQVFKREPRFIVYGESGMVQTAAPRIPETLVMDVLIGDERREARVTAWLSCMLLHYGGDHFVVLRRTRPSSVWEEVDAHRKRAKDARAAGVEQTSQPVGTRVCVVDPDEWDDAMMRGEQASPMDLCYETVEREAGPSGEARSAVAREAALEFAQLQDACESLLLLQRSDVAFDGPHAAPLELFYLLLCEWQARSGARGLRCLSFAARNAPGAEDVGTDVAARFSMALLTCVWQRAQGVQGEIDAAVRGLERALAAMGRMPSLQFVLGRMLSHADVPQMAERGAFCLHCGKAHDPGPEREDPVPVIGLPGTMGDLGELLQSAMKQTLFQSTCPACSFAAARRKCVLRGGLPAWLLFHAEEGKWVGGAPLDHFLAALSIAGQHDTDVAAHARLRAFVRRGPGDRLAVWRRDDETPEAWWVTDGSGPARRRSEKDLAGAPAAEMVCMYEVAPAGGAMHAAPDVHAYEVAAAAGAAYYDEDLGDAADAPLDAPAPRAADRAPRSPVVVDDNGEDEGASHAAPVRPIDVSRDDDVAIDPESLTLPLAAAPRDDDCVIMGEGQDTTPFAFRPRRAAQQQPLVADCHQFVTFLQQNGGATLPPNPRGSYKWGENSCPTDAALGLLYLALAVTKEGLRLLTCHRADESHGDACALGLQLLFCMHTSRTGDVSAMTRARQAVLPRLNASLRRDRGQMDSVTSTAAGLLRYVDGVVPRQGDFACRAPFPVDGRLVDVNKFTLSPWEADRMDIDERIAAACTQERMGARPPCHHCGSPRCVPRRYFDRVPPVLVFLNVSSPLPLINYVGSGLPKTLEITLYIGRACEQVRVALRLCGAVEYRPEHFVVLRPVDLDAGTWEEVDDGPGLCAPVIRTHSCMNLVALATKTTACAYSVMVLNR
eukprot:jgi/Mesvir1/8931/Mv06346-RA.1